jgi:uncharacterized protein YdeI (YjbR/CyaY-like superfamily)
MHLKTPTVPADLRLALEEIGAIAAVEEMPLAYRRRAFLFIERAENAPTRAFRVSNFVRVVQSLQDSALSEN